VRAWLEDILDDTRLFLTGPVGRWRAVRWARGLPGGMLLLTICLAVYLPGLLSIPPVDRDEARFAQASRQMFESVALPPEQRDPALHDGGLIIPKVQDRPRLNKPPLIYWAQSISAAICTAGDPARDAIWMYRLPSAIFSAIAVFFTWRLGVSAFDPRAGLLAAALLAICPMLVWDAHQARADQLLLACTTAAMWALWQIHHTHSKTRAHPIILWVALALGVLAKGPITPLVVLLSALALSLATRRFAWLKRTRPLLGLAILAALTLPWVLAVASRVGFANYWDIVTGETIGRSGSAREGHWGPPGYHLLFLVVLFWPGVLLTALSLARAARRAWGLPLPHETREQTPDSPPDDTTDPDPTPPAAKPSRLRSALAALRALPRGRAGELFCLAWIIPAWILFEIIATKLPHYVLPLYPPIALLTARGLLAAADGALPAVASAAARLGHKIWIAVGFAVAAAAPVAVAFFGDMPVVLAGMLVAGAASWLLVCAWKRLNLGHILLAQLWSALAAVVALAGFLGVVLPNADGLWLSPQIAELIRIAADPETPNAPVAAAGYHEDSLVFLTRGRLERIDDAEAWLRAHDRGVLVAPPDRIPPPDPALPTLTRIGEVRGVNYSRGRFLNIAVYRVSP